MSTARLELLTSGFWWWLTGRGVGILRVYPTQETREPTPYKFFTVVILRGTRVKFVGMRGSKVTLSDKRAIDCELTKYHFKHAVWTHKGQTKQCGHHK
jgi:hypothetical protein